MPLLRLKNTVFLTRWHPKWDMIILKTAKKYKSKSRKIVNWKRAEADGALKGIPIFFSRRDLSRRLSYITHNKYNKTYQKKHKQKSIEYNRTHVSKSILNREKIFRNLPLKVKLKFGYKPKRNPQWTPERIKLLKSLAKKHRRTKLSINWDSVMKDPKACLLPKYTKSHIRSYYWSLETRNRPDIQAKRRADALRYKYKNLKKYHENQRKRQNFIRSIINNVLDKKLKEVR